MKTNKLFSQLVFFFNVHRPQPIFSLILLAYNVVLQTLFHLFWKRYYNSHNNTHVVLIFSMLCANNNNSFKNKRVRFVFRFLLFVYISVRLRDIVLIAA